MRFKVETYDGEKYVPNFLSPIQDSKNPLYAPDSLTGWVEKFLTASPDIKSLVVDWKVGQYRYTRLPDVRVVYEIRALLPGSLRPLTDWIEVTENEFIRAGCADSFETRTREEES